MEGRIKAVFGNMVVAQVDGRVVKNAVGHCLRADGAKLLCEAIRVRGTSVDLQIFEETRGLKVGDRRSNSLPVEIKGLGGEPLQFAAGCLEPRGSLAASIVDRCDLTAPPR